MLYYVQYVVYVNFRVLTAGRNRAECVINFLVSLKKGIQAHVIKSISHHTLIGWHIGCKNVTARNISIFWLKSVRYQDKYI